MGENVAPDRVGTFVVGDLVGSAVVGAGVEGWLVVGRLEVGGVVDGASVVVDGTVGARVGEAEGVATALRQISQPDRVTEPSVCQTIVVFPGWATRKLLGPTVPVNVVAGLPPELILM